jgi:integrase
VPVDDPRPVAQDRVQRSKYSSRCGVGRTRSNWALISGIGVAGDGQLRPQREGGRAQPARDAADYPADPPSVDEIVAVIRTAGDRPDGRRLRALIVLLWRAGLRVSEALALQLSDRVGPLIDPNIRGRYRYPNG